MSDFIHSRYALGTAAISAIALTLLYYLMATPLYPGCDGGIVEMWSGQWIKEPVGNLVTGLGVNIVIIFIMAFVTRRYNVLRSVTKLPGAMYVVMMLATPSLMMYLYPGLLLCLGVVVSMWLLFASYDSPYSTRSVFMVFLILSGMSSIDYAFVLYIPVFVLGIAQMRMFHLRSIIAMLMGIATPWIILLGLGIISPDALRMPDVLAYTVPEQGVNFTIMLGVGIFTAICGVGAWLQGLMKMLSYNAKSRSMLSLIFMTMFMTIFASAVDFDHLTIYLPLLNCCAALELGHVFGTVYRRGKAHYVVLGIMAVYLLVYAWRIVVHIL